MPCYPASTRFSMEKYDPLDDLPMQFRRHPASPTPSHYSVVTNNPSPEPLKKSTGYESKPPSRASYANNITSIHATDDSRSSSNSNAGTPNAC